MKKDEVSKFLNQKVIYDGSIYLLNRYVAWRDEVTNKLRHALILIDKNKNSTIEVPIEKVEVIQDEI